MRRLLTLLVILAMTTFLIGCGTQHPVVQYKNVGVAPPANLMQDCDIEPPPAPKPYVTASPQEREKMMHDMAMKQLKFTQACNIRLGKLRKWARDQEAVFATPATIPK